VTTGDAVIVGGWGSYVICYGSQGTNASGGTTDGAAGGTPTDSATNSGIPGPGGSGGAGGKTAAGGAGSAGAKYGGGGGGGGGSLNGFNSGAGGAGGPGIVIVTTLF
jgi:hypothetical protein